RRRAAPRSVGPPRGRARTRGLHPDPQHLVLHRAPGHDAIAGMGQPAGAVRAGRGRGARGRRRDALDPAAPDGVPRREITGKGKRERGNVNVYDVETPALLLHLDVVERNLAGMAARARQLGVALRPHAKTHKCVELARLQLGRGARGLTVSTLVEAEVFARAGFGDLTWAFPIDPSHVPHACRIAAETGATLRDVGVTVRATVVSHQPGAAHFIVDAGALELSKDPGPAHVAPEAMGAVRGSPELTVATLSQEHGMIRAESPAALDGRFAVGEQLEIIPNHSCLAVAHFDQYQVVRGTGDAARVVDRWKVERGR